MNSLLKDCIDLNAQAIILLKEGQPVASSMILRNALKKFQACYKLRPSDDPDFQRNGACTFESVSIGSKLTQEIRTASAQNVFTFFPRMFHITSTGLNELGLKKTLVILMFNEAVSRHILACLYLNEHKISPLSHLSRVSKLYQTTIKAAKTSFHYQDAREMLCIIVAATNNFGHISSQLLLFTETRDSIGYMIRLLGMSDERSFQPEDVGLFFESVCIFLEGRNLRNAPAA